MLWCPVCINQNLSKLSVQFFEIIQKAILIKFFVLSKELSSIMTQCTKNNCLLMVPIYQNHWTCSFLHPHLFSKNCISQKYGFILYKNCKSLFLFLRLFPSWSFFEILFLSYCCRIYKSLLSYLWSISPLV